MLTYNFVTGANTSAVTSANAFNFNQVLQTVWTGVKWSVPGEWLHGWGALDLAGAFYYQTQNNYNFTFANGVTTATACTGAGAFISSSKCGGSQDGISFLADWRPVKRVDTYAGVMLANVYGGLANGFFNTLPVIANGRSLPPSTRRIRRITTQRSASASGSEAAPRDESRRALCFAAYGSCAPERVPRFGLR